MPKVFVPGQGWVDMASGQTAAPTVPADLLAPFSTGQASGEASSLWDSTEGPEFVKGMLRAGAGLLEAGVGMAAPQTIPALAGANFLAGTTAGLMRGEGMNAPLESGKNNLLLGLVGKGMEKSAPLLGNIFGQLAGSTTKKYGEVVDAARAFVRERDRTPWYKPAIPLGREQKLERVIGEGNQALEAAEVADPARVPLSGFQGMMDDLNKKALNSANPQERLLANRDFLDNFMRQQSRARGGATDVSMREVGNIKRDAAHSSSEIIKARQAGTMIPTGEMPRDQQLAALAQRAKELQLAYESQPGAPIATANERLSDLFTMKDANQAMRYPGMIPSGFGQMVVRAGLGAGLGGGITNATGGDYRTGASLGALAGILGLNPGNASRLGYAAGTAGRYIPTLTRTGRALADLDEGQSAFERYQEQKRSGTTRRREPRR